MERRASLSRIVRGASADVKVIAEGVGVKALNMPAFRSLKVEGTFTQKELDDAKAKSRQEGFQEGMKEAEKRLTAPIRAALENLESILDEFSVFRRDLFKESSEEIVELVRKLSKRVVHKKLSLNEEILKELVNKGLEYLERQKKVTVRLNTANHQMFVKAKPDFLEKFKNIEELDLLVSSEVPQGSAILETKTCELDIKLEDMVDHVLAQAVKGQSKPDQVNSEEDRL